MASRQNYSPATDVKVPKEDDTALSRSSTRQIGGLKTNGVSPSSSKDSPLPGAASHEQTPNRRRLVFTDTVAFRYLEDDPTTTVLERRGRLQGYELYLVEQWACSRVHPTFVITTYSGDQSHFVMVGVLAVPADESKWSPRLRVYFNAISQSHSRPKETPFGTLMVTNLSGFPSALTVIPVPDGDIRKHREDFIVNENLKRLGCSGRSGLSLAQPTSATQAKFHQLYKTSDRIPFYSAVIELIKLCQVALMMFGKLEQEYADGLLCDVTERAINDWWREIGSEYFNSEPSDGILGPTTVAALIGILMGARNRLSYYGAPVAKDVFDIGSLKRGIAYFQKSQKLDRTRRLDRQTLASLHRSTAKAAAGEGWGVPKAVKSTVAELGGKGGEMVMGMVGGGRDKAGISDIETLDIDHFVSILHGERSKWLWYGKTKRHGPGEGFGKSILENGNMIFSKDDQGGYVWSSKRASSPQPEEEAHQARRELSGDMDGTHPPGSAPNVAESPGELRKAVMKSVTGKMSDARTGFGRIKDAVGLRGHVSRHSKDEAAQEGSTGYFGPSLSSGLDMRGARPTTPNGIPKAFTWKNKPEEYQNGYPKERDPAPPKPSSTRLRDSESPRTDSKPNSISPAKNQLDSLPNDLDETSKWSAQVKDIRHDLVVNEPPVEDSVAGDLEGPLLQAERDPHKSGASLTRRHSFPGSSPFSETFHNDAYWPRHLSFANAEDVVLGWERLDSWEHDDDDDLWTAFQKQKFTSEDLRQLHSHVMRLRQQLAPWVEQKLQDVQEIDSKAALGQEELQSLYFQLTDAYKALHHNSQDLLSDERSHLNDAVRDIEALGAKLEYEINTLISKVEDVEDGMNQFGRQVDDLENTAAEMRGQLTYNTESWMHWAFRSLTGVGDAPQSRE